MQRYFAKNKIGDKFILDSGDIHHISNVMRMKNGEFIEVVYNSILYKCKVFLEDSVSIVYDSVLDSNVNDKNRFFGNFFIGVKNRWDKNH